MDYEDIKDQVVEVTHNLWYAPLHWIEDFIHEQWELRGYSVDSLRYRTHPSIQCAIHAFMRYDSRRHYIALSVLVDGVPAFLHIEGGREGSDYVQHYILNMEATKQYVQYLAALFVEVAVPPDVFLPEYLPPVGEIDMGDALVIGERDDIPSSLYYFSEYARLGKAYTYDRLCDTWMESTIDYD
jgi:hypothetical protein